VPEGPLCNASQIAERVFGGNVVRRWVLDNVPKKYRHPVGREVMYYESEVREWVSTLRKAG
jgi:hypothetical protein